MSKTDSGVDYSEFAPLDPEGNIDSETLGCHRGFTADLNLYKDTIPPGFVPYWVNTRNEGMRIRAESQGWIPANHVDSAGQIRRPDPRDPNSAGAPVDSAQRRADVSLYLMPIEQYRELRRYQETEAARMRGDVGIEYEKGPESLSLQERFGGGQGGAPIRFRARGHGFRRG